MGDSMLWNSETDTYVLFNELTEEEKRKFWENAQIKSLKVAGYEIVEKNACKKNNIVL